MTPTLILTRPKAQSESFAADIAAHWDGPLQIIQSPLIKIVPLQPAHRSPDAVIFTSANGVASASTLELPIGLTAWCVGAKTAALAQEAGFVPIVGPGDANGLIVKIISAHPRGTIAHIRGRHTRGDVSKRLSDAGIVCLDVVTYDQKELALTEEAQAAISATNFVIFPLFSPRTATILIKQAPFPASVGVILLSKAVGRMLPVGFAQQVVTAGKPDQSSMLAATLDLLNQQIGRT